MSRYSGALTILAVLGVWEWLEKAGAINPALLPSPVQIAVVLADVIISGTFLSPLGQTLGLLALGCSIGCICGCALGLGMGFNKRIYFLFEPLVELIRPIPKPALVPPLFLFLGFGIATKIVVVALGAFFPVLINTIQGVQGVDPVAIGSARTLGRSPSNIMFSVILPAALPLILTGVRVSLGLSLVLVILAEMLVGSNGIGFLVLDMQRSFRITEMYAWIFILGAVGISINALFELAERRLIPWRGS